MKSLKSSPVGFVFGPLKKRGSSDEFEAKYITDDEIEGKNGELRVPAGGAAEGEDGS